MFSITDNILYQNNEIVAVNKSPGIPVQSDKTGDTDLLEMTKKHFDQELYLVNRVDRPVSGIVVFAKSKDAYNRLMLKWSSDQVVKEYVAIVEGKWESPSTIINQKMKKGKNHKAIIHKDGKIAKLTVEAFPVFDNYSLCKIHLHTGRFHQIRCQLSHAGFPIKGDVKYGARRKNQDRSIYLHAYSLTIDDMLIKAPFPESDVLWKIANDFCNKSAD